MFASDTNLKLLVVPGDDVAAAELTIHIEGTHFTLQTVAQLLPRLQVPDEIGPSMVQLEPGQMGGHFRNAGWETMLEKCRLCFPYLW